MKHLFTWILSSTHYMGLVNDKWRSGTTVFVMNVCMAIRELQHYFHTLLSLITFSRNTSVIWWWISTVLNFFAYRNRITAQSVHFVGFSIRLFIFNKCTVCVHEVTMKHPCLLDSAWTKLTYWTFRTQSCQLHKLCGIDTLSLYSPYFLLTLVINTLLLWEIHFTCVPVSYTHLDVYKRQDQNWSTCVHISTAYLHA